MLFRQDGLYSVVLGCLLLQDKVYRNVIGGYRTRRAFSPGNTAQVVFKGHSTRKSLLFRKLLAVGHDSLGFARDPLILSKDKKRVSSYDGHPFRIEWLPGTDLNPAGGGTSASASAIVYQVINSDYVGTLPSKLIIRSCIACLLFHDLISLSRDMASARVCNDSSYTNFQGPLKRFVVLDPL